MSIHFRPAEKSDVPAIVQLVRDLADYQGKLYACKVTEELIEQNIIHKQYSQCVLALEDNTTPVGMAIYFYNFSTWTGKRGLYLEDLFVKESHRNKKIGKQMFGYLARLARENDCPRLDLSVARDNISSYEFYKRIGGEPQENWLGIRFQDDALENLESFYKPAHTNGHNGSSQNGAQ